MADLEGREYLRCGRDDMGWGQFQLCDETPRRQSWKRWNLGHVINVDFLVFVMVMVVVARVEDTVGGLVETVTDRVVMTVVVVVTHLAFSVFSWSVYGRFDFDAYVLAGFRVAAFKGINNGRCVTREG